MNPQLLAQAPLIIQRAIASGMARLPQPEPHRRKTIEQRREYQRNWMRQHRAMLHDMGLTNRGTPRKRRENRTTVNNSVTS